MTSRLHYSSLEEAYQAEKVYACREVAKSPDFYNLKQGGRGGCGKLSEYTKAKISSSLKGLMAGDKNPMYGRNIISELSPERQALKIARFRESVKGKLSGSKNGMYGKSVLDYLSEEEKVIFIAKSSARCIENSKVLAEKNKGKPWNNPAVTRFNKIQWSLADIYYSLFDKEIFGGSRAFNKVYREVLPPIPISLLKKLRDGWVPTEDNNWIEFKERFNDESH